MPSAYAHYKFGRDVYKLLPDEMKREIRKHSELYNIGLHGPDILFYYKPLWKNSVSSVGYRLHELPGAEFFERAKKLVAAEGSSKGECAYLYGFLCHYILDSNCHGYVSEKIEASGVCHTEIETEFDRFLMERDGIDPIRHSLTGHINPSRENAEVIAPFFPKVTVGQTEKALRSMKWYHGILLAPGRAKRFVVDSCMRLTGSGYESIRGMMMNYEKNDSCIDSSEWLYELYKNGLQEAAEMLPAFRRALRTGEKLPERYQRNFE